MYLLPGLANNPPNSKISLRNCLDPNKIASGALSLTSSRYHRWVIGAVLCSLWLWAICRQFEPDHLINQLVPTIKSKLSKFRSGDFAESYHPLVLYAYFNRLNSFDNAKFFLEHGLHDGADFIFIIQGDQPEFRELIPTRDNVQIIQRDNTCFDLGAFGEVLSANNNALVKQYSHFILMNASVRGPFFPFWSDDCWTDAYLSKVTKTTKLVGLSYNCKPYHGRPHIQSMLLATDSDGMDALLPAMVECPPTFQDAVLSEANCTEAIWRGGYEVYALMAAWASDTVPGHYRETCNEGDLIRSESYFGFNMHPYETIFFKANRGVLPQQLDMLTKWHDQSGYDSQDFCGSKRRRRLAG